MVFCVDANFLDDTNFPLILLGHTSLNLQFIIDIEILDSVKMHGKKLHFGNFRIFFCCSLFVTPLFPPIFFYVVKGETKFLS